MKDGPVRIVLFCMPGKLQPYKKASGWGGTFQKIQINKFYCQIFSFSHICCQNEGDCRICTKNVDIRSKCEKLPIKLSTSKKRHFRGTDSYTLSYPHYPQIEMWKENWSEDRLMERMFWRVPRILQKNYKCITEADWQKERTIFCKILKTLKQIWGYGIILIRKRAFS